MQLPNFFIIGAPKCGTSSLAAWLSGHPQIYMSPIKEPFYFSEDIQNRVITEWAIYLRLFSRASKQHLRIGEASATYLFSKVAVPAIEHTIHTGQYIVMVRNPVDMAYSLHEQQVRSFNENIDDFYQAWCLAPKRREGKQVPPGCKDPILLDYPSWCRLSEQLERLYTIVPKERVLVLLLDDMKKNPRREYLRVINFLGVPDDGRKEFPVHNPAREWRSRRMGKAIYSLARIVALFKHAEGLLPKRSLGIIQRLQGINTRQRPRPPLAPEVRAELETYFAKDIIYLERLLGRDLADWRYRHQRV